MTTIAGFSELLLTREASPEVQRSWLNLIHQDSKHVTAIVDDMLNVARIQSGHMQLEPEGVDVLEVAREVTVGMAGMSDRHRLVVEESAEAALAIADRFKLAQVLTNLLENGIKYSPEGGDIKVRAINDPSTERLVVSVTDEGMGITQENGDRLFSTFHRIRRPETEKIRGTGLGLYIVKALVELMGGEIWLNSRINHGTTFFFSLPTVERAVVVDAA
jgi:signal transduction histidine kinase